MADPRIGDAIRRLPDVLTAQAEALAALREDNKYMKQMLREIKKTVTRKYGKGDEPSTEVELQDPDNA